MWKRALIVLAGPMTNFLFAILIFAAFNMAYGVPTTPPVISEVQPKSAAADAGFGTIRAVSAARYTDSGHDRPERLLIDASRGSDGAERAPMRPAELCEQVLAEAAQIARARGVTLDAATGPAVAGAPEAPLDRTALARAAANLVANAAEHARSRVAVSCDVEGGHLVIEVADDGPGFSPAALERGCERLFTDDSSRSSRDGGRHYGLGLHAASEAASAHGGSVSLANSPSGGAVATIAVPLCGA